MRRLGPWLGAAFFVVGLVICASRRFERVEVSGHSMESTLRDGDWLIVDRRARLGAGSIVVASDPRAVGRLIVKRVRSVSSDSEMWLTSDHPAHADDLIGPVPRSDVMGVAVLRYWPGSRVGFVS